MFIGVSAPGILTTEMVTSMAENSIVFAMSNPIPEIMPDAAKAGGAAIVATGRSDFPNQVNNVLAFPGIFKGALEVRADCITDEMKIAAAKEIAAQIKEPSAEMIIPDVFTEGLASVVARAVAEKV